MLHVVGNSEQRAQQWSHGSEQQLDLASNSDGQGGMMRGTVLMGW